jgi:hypothetical protein
MLSFFWLLYLKVLLCFDLPTLSIEILQLVIFIDIINGQQQLESHHAELKCVWLIIHILMPLLPSPCCNHTISIHCIERLLETSLWPYSMQTLSTNPRQEKSRHCSPHRHITFQYSAFILLSAAGSTSILHNEGLTLPHTDCNNG